MKNGVIVFLLAISAISTNAFSEPVELKTENDKRACVISYDSEAKGSLANFGDIIVNVTVTTKTEDNRDFNKQELFKNLKITPVDFWSSHGNRTTDFLMQYALPITSITAVSTVFAAFAKWLSENINKQPEFAKPKLSLNTLQKPNLTTIALATGAIAIVGTYIARKYINHDINQSDVNPYHTITSFQAYVSKKALEKMRLQLN